MNELSILRDAKKIHSDLISWRRHFHAHPEIGLVVPRTAAFIRKILEEHKIPILTGPPGDSVVAKIEGASSENPLGLRADMDALMIPENTELPFASQIDGRMHACGHDGHMAMLLGAAVLLSKAQIPQDCYLVFQPGEEDPGGAKPLMDSGVLDKLKGIFAIHMDPLQNTGSAGINRDRAMASTDSFTIEIQGKGGHAALPHQSVDPIAISAQVINSIQFIVSRLIDPVEPAVLTLGSIQGGYLPNVIPDSVKLSGTIRTFSEKIRSQIQKELNNTLEMYCRRYGAGYDLKIIPGYPPVINTASMCDYILQTSETLGKSLKLEEMEQPRMAGEDFSYYLQKIPGAFYWLGCRNEQTGCSYPLHHSRFNLDEDALPLGTALHTLTALNFNYASGQNGVSL